MKNLVQNLLLLAVLTLPATFVQAQINTPAASPTAEFKQQVGLTDVEIVYSRPSVKDREVFGELVPFGDVWRTGANAATKVAFSDEVTLGGKKLEGGSYAMLTKPGENNWEVMLFPYESWDYMTYLDLTPAATINVKPVETDYFVETFLINVDNVHNTGATIDILWENTLVSIPLEVNVDERVMAQINRVMSGPSAGDYYAAATYYHEAGKDLNKALEWIQKANAENPRYWTLRREALILADLEMYDKAVEVAKKSKEMAEEAGNNDYVRMNDASIKMWSKM